MAKNEKKTAGRDAPSAAPAEAPAGAGWFLVVIAGLFGLAIALGLLTQ